MRFSILIAVGFAALFAVTVTVAGVAYFSFGETISSLKRMSATLEPTRRRLDELYFLVTRADSRLRQFTSAEFVHPAELRNVFGLFDDHLRRHARILGDLADGIRDDVETVIARKAEAPSQTAEWERARSNLDNRLSRIRTALTRDRGASGHLPRIDAILTVLDEVETLFQEYSEQPDVTLEDIVSPLNRALRLVNLMRAEIMENPFLPVEDELAALQSSLSQLKGATVLFDDEISLLVTGANLREIFETADSARNSAVSTLNRLQIAVEYQILFLQRDQIAEGDRRQVWFLVFIFVAVFTAAFAALVLHAVLSRRITRLVESTQEIANGNYRTRISSDAHDEFDQIAGSVNVMVDELVNKIDALVDAQADARKAKDEADNANRMKSAFLANMSHELRTPLNAIIGFSGAIRSQMYGKLGSPRYEEYVEDIESSGRHLLRLINSILDLSKIEAGKTDFEDEVIDLSNLCFEAVKSVEDQATRKQIQLVTRINPSLPKLQADRTAVRQILLNLLSNSIKFTEGGGLVEIDITLEEEGGHRIAIVDSGVGIPPKDIEFVMAPFGQSRTAANHSEEGTGLGLPITRSLVENFGGRFNLYSELGSGTNAVVNFPPERVVHDA